MSVIFFIIVFFTIYWVGFLIGHDRGLKHRIKQKELDKWGEP